MNKITIPGIELDLYSKTLNNGLTVYIIPKNDIEDTFVTFTTKYGSVHNDFIPLGKDTMYTVPSGIAHFLEHKMFEQEDGTDPFTIFEQNGAMANANTWFHRTVYLFNTTEKLKDNLNFLLDYVQSPYFTDENVEKEKGIIIQEINMYLDDAIDRFYEASRANAFIKDPIKISVIGTEETVSSITKEDLYLCYNTFYHPSNMFVLVTGNVNPDEVIKIIETNQSNKNYPKAKEIVLKEFLEPDQIDVKKEMIKMDVKIPKISYNFKIRIPEIKELDKDIVIGYISAFFNSKFDATSTFTEKMRSSGIVNKGIDVYSTESNNYMLYTISAETEKYDEFARSVETEMQDLFVGEKEFLRKKKMMLAGVVTTSEDIVGLNYYFLENIAKRGKIKTDIYNDIKEMNYETFKNIINNINFENTNIVILESK